MASHAKLSDRNPEFSFVATSRNDDHGGDVLRRTQSFVSGLAAQSKRHRVACELVLVDWNPPVGRAPLLDVLAWPEGNEWFSARVITVPREVHLSLANARSLTMYQMIAKNVGIRRAAGAYTIATNIDIVFSDELFAWLRSTPLDRDTLYRSDRWDMANEIQLEPDFDRLLRRARDEAFRRNLRDGTYTLENGKWVSPFVERVDRFLLGPIQHSLQVIKGMIEAGESPLAEIDHVLSDLMPRSRKFYLAPMGHLNGCGDFTMLSRKAWEKLRGYPEWPIFSWNIDSVAVIHAALLGIAQVDLPADAVHYHIEHDYGSGYTPGGMGALLRRMHQRSIPLIDWERYQSLVGEMVDRAASEQELQFNDTDWGFAQHDLPIAEVRLGRASDAAVRNIGAALQEPFATDGLSSQSLNVTDAEVLGETEFSWARGRFSLSTSIDAGMGEVLVDWPMPKEIGDRPFWLRCYVRLIQGVINVGIVVGGTTRTVPFAVVEFDPSEGFREIILAIPSGVGATGIVCAAAKDGAVSVEIADPEIFWKPSDARARGDASHVVRIFGGESDDDARDNPPLLDGSRIAPLVLKLKRLPPSRQTHDILPFLSRKDWVEERRDALVIPAQAPHGHALYGPYTHVPPGKYELALEAATPSADDSVCLVLEVALTSGRVLTSKDVISRDLAAGPIIVPFEVPGSESADQLETRLSHFGLGDISVTAVHLRAESH